MRRQCAAPSFQELSGICMDYLVNGFSSALALLAHMDAATLSAIYATLLSTCYAMTAALLLGLPMGFALGYCSFPGRRALRLVSDTLLAFPTVLIGLLVYAFITARGPLGQYGLLFTLPGMAVGQAVLALPIVVSWTAQAVESLDPRCRETLLTLGANARQVTALSLWECRYSIGMVCITAFGRVITEVGVAMMLGGNIRYATRTMTTAIALETSKGDFAQGIALGLILLLMAFVINLVLAFFRHRERA
ncbi:Binding-protein-dependent transport systems inner membrane component [uncultured Desulfovibrio sp.]|uniref:Binding-protein-dependent transport systems inner membrane component n=2 Tax=Desulfovibrio TaxID=872 RepID=A0A212L0Q6_9BACT|nr:Binding-protein-dependent transport systems inner membrane component [uncultured Desulfovibrio sp.]VZH32747.1 Tungstate uptake system permease protein TupB [Desulfovibrio sp. 86]